jgi:hypothetical protein
MKRGMMAQKVLASGNMSREFSTFSITPDGTEPSLAEVKRQLQAVGHRYGIFVRVVADGSHMVVRLFDANTERFSDLKTGPDTKLSDILNTKGIMLTISETDAPGIVIVDEGEAVGVLPSETLRAYFDQRDFTVRTRMLGDWGIHGDIRVDAYRISCARSGCGALNIVSGFDPGRTKCVNGHVLEVKAK